MTRPPRLVVIDDDPEKRELFRHLLADYDYEILDAADGEAGLELARTHLPDLVITDLMLPKMNGFEVARQLKQSNSGDFLPVIVVTNLNDQSSRLLAFRVGADDFFSHPVDRIELGVRIAGLLQQRRRHQALAQRTIELAELQRFKDEMSTTVVHDLKNPLSVILTNLAWTFEELEKAPPEELRDALDDSLHAGRRMLRLLTNLVDVTRSDARQLHLQRVPTSLGRVLQSLARQRRVIAQSRDIRLEIEVRDDVEAAIDADMVTRALENIVDNALRYTPSSGRIVGRVERVGDSAVVSIGNDGPPIPVAARASIFEKYGQAGPAGRMNLGLGLYFCRLTAEAHGGTLTLDATAELPTIFRLTVPLVPAPASRD